MEDSSLGNEHKSNTDRRDKISKKKRQARKQQIKRSGGKRSDDGTSMQTKNVGCLNALPIELRNVIGDSLCFRCCLAYVLGSAGILTEKVGGFLQSKRDSGSRQVGGVI